MLNFPEKTELTEAQINRMLDIEERYLTLREKEYEAGKERVGKELEIRAQHVANQRDKIARANASTTGTDTSKRVHPPAGPQTPR